MNPQIRNRIEHFFSSLAGILYRHRLKSLGLTLAVAATLTCLIPRVAIDTSAVALLRQSDPTRMQYDAFRDRFNENEMLVIGVTPPEVFDLAFLKRLKSFHEELQEQVPHIKEITSLINARNTYSRDNELVVGALLDTWPTTRSDIEDLRNRVFANPLYIDTLISKDGKVTTLMVETCAVLQDPVQENDLLDGFEDAGAISDGESPTPEKASAPRYFSEPENREVIAAINKVIATYDGPDFSISMAGNPVVLDVYNRAMEIDIVKVVLLSLLTIAVFLTLLFRRVSGVLLPELVIIFAMLSTGGLLALFHVTIKLTTVVLPGFLLAVSVGYAVHILAIFYVQFQRGLSKEKAITYAVGHSGFAVVLTALTTAGSLLSFAFAELTAIADLGFFGAIGTLLALVYTLLLLPACIALFPIRRKPDSRENLKSAAMDTVLLAFSRFSTRHPKKVVAGALVLFGLSIYATCMVSYSHNALNWIAAKEKLTVDVPYIDVHMNGSIVLEVILDTQITDGVKEPLFLNRLQAFKQEILTYVDPHLQVGKIYAIDDILMEVNQSLNDNDPAFYDIPKTKDAISQELLLFENSGSDDLERFVDRDYRITRLSIKIHWIDAVHLKPFITYIQTLVTHHFPEIEAPVITGIPALMSRSIPASLHSMAKSYVIAFLVITLLMILHVGDVKIGLLSMISNLLPIFMTMGIMGVFSIKLDMSTIMIGSIAIGIVVDDTLHFMYNFRKFLDQTGNAHLAIEKTMLGTGRALLLTSLILSSGFFILMTASLSLLIMFGWLTGITIVFALLADFIVNPALMVLVSGRQTQATLAADPSSEVVHHYSP
jgi:predicted RND superfamily exporter protein